MAAVVNEIREECLRRRDFRAIAEFIRPVQDRIDSLIITGCVSVQKWYDNYSANEQLVTRTIAKLIAVSRELLLVSEYLVNISSGFRLASQ